MYCSEVFASGKTSAGVEASKRVFPSAGKRNVVNWRAFGVTVKLRRAHGGCLGDERRRRTWTAAKSFGEPLTGCDPEISEWGNPRWDNQPSGTEYIGVRKPSQGTETSKYLDERKSRETPSVVASERGSA